MTRAADTSNTTVDAIEERLRQIEAARQDADIWRKHGGRLRPFVAFAAVSGSALIACGIILGLLTLAFLTIFAYNQGLEDSKQLKFALMLPELTRTEYPRALRTDVETSGALGLTSYWVKQGIVNYEDRTGRRLRESMGSLDEGIRQVLSDVSVRLFNDTELGAFLSREEVQRVPARCVVAGSLAASGANNADRTSERLIARNDFGFVPIEALPKGSVPVAREVRAGELWVAVRRQVTAGGEELVASKNTDTMVQVDTGSILCLADDASLLMVWPPSLDTSQMFLRKYVWLDFGGGAWAGYAHKLRLATTEYSFAAIAKHHAAMTGPRPGPRVSGIEFFRHGDQIGFLHRQDPSRTAIIWTTTGLADAEVFSGNSSTAAEVKGQLVPCSEYALRNDLRRTIVDGVDLHRCDLGNVTVDGVNYMLAIEYALGWEEHPWLSEARGRPCSTKRALCRFSIKLEFPPSPSELVKDSSGALPPRLWRTAVEHISARIVNGAVIEKTNERGEVLYDLWLRDEDDRFWRYTVGTQSLQPLIAARWLGLDDKNKGDRQPSEHCTELECDKFVPP